MFDMGSHRAMSPCLQQVEAMVSMKQRQFAMLASILCPEISDITQSALKISTVLKSSICSYTYTHHKPATKPAVLEQTQLGFPVEGQPILDEQ